MRRKLLRGWVLVSLTVLFFACGREQPQSPVQWVPVRVQQVGLSKVAVGSVRYTAVLTPNSQVNLAFKVNGYIQSILQRSGPEGTKHPITQGEAVHTGEVLARINDDQYVDKVNAAEATLAGANAALDKGTADFKRAQSLLASRSMTESDFDSAQQEYQTAKANVASAKAQLDDARLNLAHCALTAPINGLVIKRSIEVGDLVAPGAEAFVLADMSAMKVLFAVPDFMLKNLAIGDHLSISTRSVPQRMFSGAITSIAPTADTQTRVFNVELTLPNPDGVLKDGMVAALSVPESLKPSTPRITVPITAVVRSKANPDGYAVYVVQQDGSQSRARLRDVTLGTVQGNRVVVLNGINSGDQVVVSGVNTVWDGATVRVVN
jgi:RND family efflux transporter MFP subunit